MIRPVRGHVQCRRLPRTFERGAKPRLAVVLDGYGVVVAKRAGAGPAKAARFDPGETLATDDIVAEPDLGSGVPRCLYQAEIANIRAWTDDESDVGRRFSNPLRGEYRQGAPQGVARTADVVGASRPRPQPGVDLRATGR
jgi:hypothetical protein